MSLVMDASRVCWQGCLTGCPTCTPVPWGQALSSGRACCNPHNRTFPPPTCHAGCTIPTRGRLARLSMWTRMEPSTCARSPSPRLWRVSGRAALLGSRSTAGCCWPVTWQLGGCSGGRAAAAANAAAAAPRGQHPQPSNPTTQPCLRPADDGVLHIVADPTTMAEALPKLDLRRARLLARLGTVWQQRSR